MGFTKLAGCDQHHQNISRSGGWVFAAAATIGLYMWYNMTSKEDSKAARSSSSSSSGSDDNENSSETAKACIYLDYNGTNMKRFSCFCIFMLVVFLYDVFLSFVFSSYLFLIFQFSFLFLFF